MFSISKEKEINIQDYRNIWKQNVQKVIKKMQDELKVQPKSVILLEGSGSKGVNDEDTEHTEFYQNGHFMYLFGIERVDCVGVVEVDTGRQVVFVPRIAEENKLWMKVETKQEVQESEQLDQVYYTDELETYFKEYQPNVVYLNKGINTDSGLSPVDLLTHPLTSSWLHDYPTNTSDLFEIMSESRVTKTRSEIELLEWITQLTCEGHVQMMQGMMVGMKEYQLANLFMSYIKNNCNGLYGYQPICASGTNAAILHYIQNDQVIQPQQLVLSDQGAKWKGYTSDVTTTFPANGHFTIHQQHIYEAVLDANQKVFQQCRPGVKWDDMHHLAEHTILNHLQQHNIVSQTHSIDQLQTANIGSVFMPHGLGHLIGLQVHDVGGYNTTCPPRRQQPGFNKLRTARYLQPYMCLTIEPGCYFIPHLLKQTKDDPLLQHFINWDKVNEYSYVGGVRIEDDVYITEDACCNMSRDLPRTVQQIEACMAGKPWRNI